MLISIQLGRAIDLWDFYREVEANGAGIQKDCSEVGPEKVLGIKRNLEEQGAVQVHFITENCASFWD